MSSQRWLVLAAVLPLAAGALLAACGGGADSGEPPDLSRIPTATPPDPLPEALIVSGTPRPTGDGATYTVADGDSLSAIADRFGTTVEAIAEANSIADPTQLEVGQVLTIPGAPAAEGGVLDATEEPLATATPVPTEPPATQTYIVQEGDIPETIAAQFGITAEELMAANGITDPASLQVGQELIIPEPSTPTPAA